MLAQISCASTIVAMTSDSSQQSYIPANTGTLDKASWLLMKVYREKYYLRVYLLACVLSLLAFWHIHPVLGLHFLLLFAYEFTAGKWGARLERRIVLSRPELNEGARFRLFGHLEDYNQAIKYSVWFAFFAHLLSPGLLPVFAFSGLLLPLVDRVHGHVLVRKNKSTISYSVPLRNYQLAPYFLVLVLCLMAIAVWKGAPYYFWIYATYMLMMNLMNLLFLSVCCCALCRTSCCLSRSFFGVVPVGWPFFPCLAQCLC